MKIIRTFKTYNSSIFKIRFFDQKFFFAFTPLNKFYYYKIEDKKPLKSFRLNNNKFKDALIISSEDMIIATDHGDVRYLQINHKEKQIKIIYTFDLKAEIIYLDSFFKNKKLILINTVKNEEGTLFLFNVNNHQIMNKINLSQRVYFRNILTISNFLKSMNISVLSFLNNGKIGVCDITSKKISEFLKKDFKNDYVNSFDNISMKILNVHKRKLIVLFVNRDGIRILQIF